MVKIPKLEDSEVIIIDDNAIGESRVNASDENVAEHYSLSQSWVPLSLPSLSKLAVPLYLEQPYGSSTAVIGCVTLKGLEGISRLVSAQSVQLRMKITSDDRIFVVVTVGMPLTAQTHSVMAPVTTAPVLTASDISYLSSLSHKHCLYLLLDTASLDPDPTNIDVCAPDPSPDLTQSVPDYAATDDMEVATDHYVPDPTLSPDPVSLTVLVVATEGLMCLGTPSMLPARPQLTARIMKLIQPHGYHGYKTSSKKEGVEVYGDLSHGEYQYMYLCTVYHYNYIVCTFVR